MSSPTSPSSEPAGAQFDRWFLAVLSILMILLIMGYLFAVSFMSLSTTGAKYADIAVPLLLGTGIGGILGFFYGASKKQQAPTDGGTVGVNKTYPQAGSIVVAPNTETPAVK